MTRIRTLDFLPTIFQTPSNSQFLGATLDQLVNPPVTKKIQGYVGSKFGYGVNAKNYYVTEPTKVRTDYQLEPGVVFLKANETTATDFISYPGMLDALKLQGGITDNNDILFESQFYSWDSFTNLDKIINYNQYYWLPDGPPVVTVFNDVVFLTNEYSVESLDNSYKLIPLGATNSSENPTLTLIRGGTYEFKLKNQSGGFWIQGAPGVNGTSPTQENLSVRLPFIEGVGGVINNGGTGDETIIFKVPLKDSMNQYNYPGNNTVGVVSTKPFNQVNGKKLSEVGNIDGVTALQNQTVMFYSGEPAYSSYFYTITYDYTLSSTDPTIVLVQASGIPTGQKITAEYGRQYVGIPFVKIGNVVEPIPYIFAPLDTLYYQNDKNSNKVGIIKLIENNDVNTLNVDTQIIGQQNFTSSNGIKFTNGLKVAFSGDIFPTSYKQNQYYVEGVGTSIELIPVESLIVPEPFTTQTSIPFDSTNFDIGNYDAGLFIPFNPDYITIARNSINKNAWSRSNRWFHKQVIDNTADYNSDPTILNLANKDNKAQRPIIEFYPNLKLFNSGTIGKAAVDFIDTRNTDALSTVAGQAVYYPDVSTYTDYTGSIYPNPTVTQGEFIAGEQYTILTLGTTDEQTWIQLGAVQKVDGTFVPGVQYIITDLGLTTDWNAIAGTTDTDAADIIGGLTYQITDLGSTNWNAIGYIGVPVVGGIFTATSAGTGTGTANVVYSIGSIFTAATEGNTTGSGSGTALETLFTATGTGSFNSSEFIAGLQYTIEVLGFTQWNNIGYVGTPVVGGTFFATAPAVGTGSAIQGNGTALSETSTKIQIDVADVNGSLTEGMYINDQIFDYQSQLPADSRILSIEVVTPFAGDPYYSIVVNWPIPTQVQGTAALGPSVSASFVASVKNNIDLALFAGARVVFAADANPLVANKIYVANLSTTIAGSYPVITLTEALDGAIQTYDQFAVTRGQTYQGTSFYYEPTMDGQYFHQAQQKTTVNQPPKFDIFDKNDISFGDATVYESTTFEGNELFRYKVNIGGVNDTVLGFPITYNSINNVSDIRFEVALNTDTFNYVKGVQQNVTETVKINTGYVHNVTARETFVKEIGYQTAVAPSVQYQIFDFTYTPIDPTQVLGSGESIPFTMECDVAQSNISTTVWPSLQVYNNNTLLSPDNYTVEVGANYTTITVNLTVNIETIIQVAILSDQVSAEGYYGIPINLSNNPFNTDITNVDVGDIRGQYLSIFQNLQNNPNLQGEAFGSNNIRDLGNIVPYGNRIIQNSASLVLPGAFLRKTEHNLFDSLLFNSREYVKFKNLLVDTANSIDWQQQYNPSNLLDECLEIISGVKNQEMPFFWSDMLPNKAAYIVNTYNLYNSIDISTYPLSMIYNFASANYNGVLVYLQTVVEGTTVTKQLIKDVDYNVSADSPSLTITKDLTKGDVIIVKEYNQTYGSYVPNTPTKLGLYPSTIPNVTLDNSYTEPTYFIVGHDGSYNKLYGEYSEELGLIDYRDQVLLEFETRIYNNLKLSNTVPIQAADTIPGYFRSIGTSYDKWLEIYSLAFLDWIGSNRLDYTAHYFEQDNPYSYNFKNSSNKLNGSLISQGGWRGMYLYYYDTSTPNTTPWEMIGYSNKPSWWETRYGPAPYTSDNLILWTDLEQGYDYGSPVLTSADLVVGQTYKIISLGTTDWNIVAGTTGIAYSVGDNVKVASASIGTGTANSIKLVYARPGLLNILPTDNQGNLRNPIESIVAAYDFKLFVDKWNIGDVAPVEFSYRRSSTWPFDLMRLQALIKPAEFFNLGVDLDNYKYNAYFNQYLINDRSHLIPKNIEIYGNGIAKTSYINWIVDYEKQLGVGATENISKLLTDLDVRLVYRLAGFSDKTLLKFFVEKGSPNSKNASLLIPDESYQVLLYQNQAYDRLTYSSVIIQKEINGYRVSGNSQVTNYFKTLEPVNNGNTKTITVQDVTVKVSQNFTDNVDIVSYGTLFRKAQDVAQFLMNYGAYLESLGAEFKTIESGIQIDWTQMVAEFLYWTQVGWTPSSIITLNPSASTLTINRESQIVQPLTIRQNNFILNQNLYPIENRDLSVFRDGTEFSVTALNRGDTIAYGQFDLSNIEHGIVFDNVTIFDDVIYNLVSGLRQNRIYVQGNKSAEWNGTMFISGFIYNQDNITEWQPGVKYTKGSIVKFKNKYWTALRVVQPEKIFNELFWKETDYNEVQKGLLPNSSTRSAESALYYNVNEANLEQDADQLSFSLIGFRSRPYMVSADLTDITQVNVYKNLIKDKGTRNALNAFKGANLPQGGIDYDIYENWAILQGTFGGVLNNNFVEFKVNQNNLTANPSIVGLSDGQNVEDAQQIIPIYSLYNYGQTITSPDVLPLLPKDTPNQLYPDAGYVNINDVKMSAYFYSQLPVAVGKTGLVVPINNFYVGDYVWLANYLATWDVMTPSVISQVIQARANLNGTVTITFKEPHNLSQYDLFAIVNFDTSINGYYVASQIVNTTQVLIPLTLSNSVRTINGQGIAYKFQSQRVSQPSDIQDLPLINNEFVKNEVWVDTNDDGGWAVYRKSINYEYDREFTLDPSATFGSAVSYTLKGDYLFGDSGLGTVYRYQYDALTGEYGDYDSLTQQYLPDQTLTQDETFGATIKRAQNIFAIAQTGNKTLPLVDPKVFIYYVNDTTYTDDILYMQEIAAPVGTVNFGNGMAMSGDSEWLFVSDYDDSTPAARNNVHIYRRKSGIVNATNLVTNTFYQIKTLGTTDFTSYGAVENKVGIIFQATGSGLGTGTVLEREYEYITYISGPTVLPDKFGYNISTNYYGDTVSIAAPEEDYNEQTENWGKVYVYNRSVQNFEAQASSSASPTSFSLAWTPDPLTTVNVFRNGTLVDQSEYSIVGSSLVYNGTFNIGDIINVSGNQFTLNQTLTTETNPRIGVGFGLGLDNNTFASEILVGAPYALSSNNEEGAVYRYTNGGARFGIVTGTDDVNVTANRVILINGYSVTIPSGSDASLAALAINNAGITNVSAVPVNNTLQIGLNDPTLAQASQELIITSTDIDALAELGINLYTQTQVIQCPHLTGPTQFGTAIKFNEYNSVVISAPVGTRYAQTTFDFTDDLNLDNDTIFDNNATQFIDTYKNAGAVYMYDYLSNYNESLTNIGAYTYAQSTNDTSENYGSQPYFGTQLEFTENKVVIGTPNYRPEDIDGQVIIYINNAGVQDWVVYRQSCDVVDVSKIQNAQIFSAELNQTLVNLDYFDPLQGKLLGAVRQNIDIVSNTDPASYNNDSNTQSGFVWGASQVGSIWLDTTNMRFLNYHQNDNAYNAKYWGTLFPGSDVAVYSWIASEVPPINYNGAGVPKDINLFTVQTVLNSSNAIQPIYYFWVRNSGIIFTKKNKTLADTNLAAYISNPLASGISYFSPLLPNTFALYNFQQFVNANDSVLHIAYNTTDKDDIAHTEYDLIRENFPSDFLPGVPSTFATQDNIEVFDTSYNILGSTPEGLYARLLDSLSGCDYLGAVVPDPFLPKAVQSGVLARPKQSFFYNRFKALENYIQYANSVLKLYPITEIRPNISFLQRTGEFYDTTDYWEYINWWATGFDDNTKSSVQVNYYADLATLNVPTGTIVTVKFGTGTNSSTYIYKEDGTWTRIGLQNGTIKFKSELYNYALGKTGFGDDFYGTTPFDQYPSTETYYIVRGLNEQIYTNELLIYRNRSLILLFEYIQAESVENQNYLPWLNKTSLIDVSHTIRELVQLQNFQSDNEEFLEGYVNETKPYHVVIKEFLFDYKGTDIYQGNLTDFDLPATYDYGSQQFITPELVYGTISNGSQFNPTNSIWDLPEYTEWFNNYGVSLTGQENYLITTLNSYLTLNSDFIIVSNAQGFPINGTIKIASIADPTKFEILSYTTIDRSLNKLSGLVRGLHGTEVYDHIPGENIYIDLPAVVVLDSGSGYVNPPRIKAYIDTTKYPVPKQEAILQAVMSVDKVIGVTVINPGNGYAVLPEIIIDPSETVEFTSESVAGAPDYTISLSASYLNTGDLVRYVKIDGNNIGLLEDGQWYYVNVLNYSPTTVIALYTTFSDAVKDKNRVKIYNQDSISDTPSKQSLESGAKASAISTSYPIRENNITLRYDRTTYDSQVKNWTPGSFYGSFFAGSYNNTESVASSSISLESTLPDINTITASKQGLALPVSSVSNEQTILWSDFQRTIYATANTDIITLNVGTTTENASGSTIGLTIGMPIKFIGDVGSSNIVEGVTYYVADVVNETQFKISATALGPVFSLANQTISGFGLSCYTAQVKNQAIITTYYPGIREVTGTNATNNTVTIQTNPYGTWGTTGLYTGIPLEFVFPENYVGTNFGGIEQNLIYYVTSVIDGQTVTLSQTNDFIRLKALSINAANQMIVESTVGLNEGDQIVFSNMYIDGTSVTNFGNIIAGNFYYVKSIGINVITLSDTYNGTEKVLTPVTSNANTYCYFVSQENNVELTTVFGSITVNVQLPASPGQVDGQYFTFYPTSATYPNITTFTYGDLLESTIAKTLTGSNIVAITEESGGTTGMYVGMPFTVASNIGGLLTGTTYYVAELGSIEITVSSTSATNNRLTVTGSTDNLYIDMPVIFSGNPLGGLVPNVKYYIKSIESATEFTISQTVGGSTLTLTSTVGEMNGSGEPYVTVSDTKFGSIKSLTTATGPVTLNQKITVDPTFDVSYILGGYRVTIVDGGEGFTINNTITIPGNLLGGTTPYNDAILSVNTINAIVPGTYSWSLPLRSDGTITSVSCQGTTTGLNLGYYLKVISANSFEVYSDPRLTVPVNGLTFQYTSGDWMLLPEPFYFNQSIVKYNNKLYICVISNNDYTFNLGKWEELQSGDRRLNAMDRVKGYYQPTVNMPGAELEQLFTGVTYPNTTYKGNAFDPAQEYSIDTYLQDQEFYPVGVDIDAITYNGTNYIAAANLPTQTALAMDLEVTDNWVLGKVSDYPLNLSDLIKNNSIYFMTSQNSATPILKSADGTSWSTNGYFIPYGTLPSEIIFARKLLTQAQLSLNAVTYGNGKYIVAGNDICTSDDVGTIWRETYSFSTSDTGTFYDVAYVDTSFFNGYVAVGTKNNNKLIVYSTDGITWTEVPSGNITGSSTATLKAVTSNDSCIIVVGNDGDIYKAVSLTSWVYVTSVVDNLNDVTYNDNIFAAVGNNGKVVTSVDGSTWVTKATGTTKTLNVIFYESETDTFTIGGNDNTLLQTEDISKVIVDWDKTQVFTIPNPAYTIKGDPFLSGYGPEELVPGLVTDQLTMIVTTRPGTNWSATEFAHVGYNTVSIELPASVTNNYSFANVSEVPALVSVYIVDNDLGTRIYPDIDYTISYADKTITLDTNITGSQKLRIDVYEVGNGDQLVKSNTDISPLIVNDDTLFQTIYLNCNYSNYRFTGGGIINPATDTYYTQPAVFCNGTQLVPGVTNVVYRTKSSNNALVTYDTSNLTVDQQIVFDKNITSIYNGLAPNTKYYIKQIIDSSQFTISTTVGGPVITLNNGTGISNFITNDFAVILNPINQTSADLIFPAFYDTDVDYISFSFFNETEPSQYGFTLPLTQVFNGNGTKGSYALTNYLGDENDTNAIVEVNGLRIMPDQYTIYYGLNSLVFDTLAPTVNDVIAVTTFNDTARQYLNTQYELSPVQVTPILTLLNTLTPPLNDDIQTSSSDGTWFYVDNTTNMVLGQNVQFQVDIPGSSPVYTGFGGVDVDGTVYTLSDCVVLNPVTKSGKIQVQDQYGNTYPNAAGAGLMQVSIGGQPTVRVQTTLPHGLTTNDVIRMDGLTGSIQLNGNIFYAHVITDTIFDIYMQEYSPYVDGVNYPVTICDTYTGEGYVWLEQSWMLETTQATDNDTTYITVNSALQLVEGTPVIFTEADVRMGEATSIAEIIAGQIYYISTLDILNNKFSITESRGGNELTLTTNTGYNIRVSQWEQTNVDRLWVTVNGMRVSSDALRLSEGNEVSILAPININDEIIITSMMPSATPNELVYINAVDRDNQGVVYRANADTKTWLTQPVGEFDTIIYVNDIDKVTNENIQTSTTPILELGYYYIPLIGDKNNIIDVTVYNNAAGRTGYIDQNYLQLEVRSSAAYIRIEEGSYIEPGDSLTITNHEGSLIYVQGEYMQMISVDTTDNSIEVGRGALGTGVQVYIPANSIAYGLLDDNKMTTINYNDTWNKIPGQYDATLGDPLQIASGSAPQFLRMDT